MPLTPVWRLRLVTAVAVIAAIWLGAGVAQGESLPALAAAVLGIFVLIQWLRLPLGTWLLGAAIFGYIVGNRGFAQISISSVFPILPAEAVLAMAGGLLCVQCAWRHELPIRRDPLNFVLLLWMLAGAVRIGFDFRMHGFMAVRDFAMVYYAAFFFLGQDAGRTAAGRTFLQRALLVSCAVLLPLSVLYNRYPDFFLSTLTLRGIPVIFYKGDLVGTFLAVGSVLFYLRYETSGRWWNVAVSLIFGAAVLATGNRASLLGLMMATLWLAVGRRWKFAVIQASAGALAVAVILLGSTVLHISWEKTPVFGVYERLVSIVDPSGQRVYRSEDSLSKGDNNIFRRVWWQAVIDETIEGNPYVGLGFGHDLAERFVREYYADSTEDFSVRSPHNILLTVFARMGAVGLVIFLAFMALVAIRTWRAVRDGPRAASLWCCVWVLFVSACFGVVLEGPMGAVVFWTILGVANASEVGEEVAETAEDPASLPPADLHPLEPADEVPASL